MRWRVKVINSPQFGQTRIIKKFLFLPKCIGDEWRWLERVYIVQKCGIDYDTYGLGAVPYYTWKDYAWEKDFPGRID